MKNQSSPEAMTMDEFDEGILRMIREMSTEDLIWNVEDINRQLRLIKEETDRLENEMEEKVMKIRQDKMRKWKRGERVKEMNQVEYEFFVAVDGLKMHHPDYLKEQREPLLMELSRREVQLGIDLLSQIEGTDEHPLERMIDRCLD